MPVFRPLCRVQVWVGVMIISLFKLRCNRLKPKLSSVPPQAKLFMPKVTITKAIASMTKAIGILINRPDHNLLLPM